MSSHLDCALPSSSRASAYTATSLFDVNLLSVVSFALTFAHSPPSLFGRHTAPSAGILIGLRNPSSFSRTGTCPLVAACILYGFVLAPRIFRVGSTTRLVRVSSDRVRRGGFGLAANDRSGARPIPHVY